MHTRRNATVSLCMIVRNEEANLAACLEPVADLFDEIVIVDTGSQDGTREIASRFTPHVFDFPWCDDFAAARNESLRQAHGDWIFWLDADDRLTPENVEKLRCLLDGLDDQPRVFMVPVFSGSNDTSNDTWVITHPRLFKANPELGWKGRVHEQLWPPPGTLGYETVDNDVQIVHVGYRDAVLYGRKRQRKMRLLRMDYAADPDDLSTLYHLALACAEVGDQEKAQSYFDRVLQLGCPSACLRRAFVVMADMYRRLGNLVQALAIIEQGLVRFPGDMPILYCQADVLYKLQQHQPAANVLRAIIHSPDQDEWHDGAPADIKSRLAPRLLGSVLRVQGAHSEAAAILRLVVKAFPTDTQAWYNLGLVYVEADAQEYLRIVLARLPECLQGDLFAKLLRALWDVRHNQLGSAEDLIDELVAEFPIMPLPRMIRAECLARRKAPLGDLDQALRDVLRVDPGNLEAIYWLEQVNAANRPAPVVTPADFGTPIVVGAGVAVT